MGSTGSHSDENRRRFLPVASATAWRGQETFCRFAGRTFKERATRVLWLEEVCTGSRSLSQGPADSPLRPDRWAPALQALLADPEAPALTLDPPRTAGTPCFAAPRLLMARRAGSAPGLGCVVSPPRVARLCRLGSRSLLVVMRKRGPSASRCCWARAEVAESAEVQFGLS